MGLVSVSVHVLAMFLTLVECQRIILRTGRHVCKQEKVSMAPVLRTRSVCIPYYHRTYHPCRNDTRRMCPYVRLQYRTEFRRVRMFVPQRRSVYTCCPGWAGYNFMQNTCNTPLCDPRCHNGGNCRLPNRCACPNGWNGTICQSDVNECSSSPCDQKCVNLDGSFRCECYQGYRLAQDGHTCSLCLSCTDEFTRILQEQKELQKTIVRLEQHNVIMMSNLSTLHKDLQTLTSLPVVLTTSTPLTTSGSGEKFEEDATDELEAYMASISEQIAMLEERLDVCTCNRARSPFSVSMSNNRGMNNRRYGNGKQPQRAPPSRRRKMKPPPPPTSTTTTTTATKTTTTLSSTVTPWFFNINRPPA